MTDDQIKHMVNRFLGYTMPDNFQPDGGISYKRDPRYPNHPMPSGTNILDATQAQAMVRYMVEGLPVKSLDLRWNEGKED